MSEASTPGPTPEQLKAAFKAFKKKLKLMRLDEESRLGGGPLSSGRRSSIVSIQPPDQYSHEVWEALVRQGKLRRGPAGTYELVETA